MAKKLLIFFGLIVLCSGMVSAQSNCTVLGQNPQTAFPVCGLTSFKQDDVPQCGNTNVPVPGCGGGYTNVNPFWYKFTCFGSGTLGLLITPNTLADDYDWQIFDVTGHIPGDVFTDASLFVSANWSAVSGSTGTSSGNQGSVNCGGYAYPNMNSYPTLIKGHNYLLLISHFTPTQSGYSLSFDGGTANITDPTPPELVKAQAGCDGSEVLVVLNKKMKCGSLAANGSDFTVSPASVTVTAAEGNSCSAGFDMDTVLLTLSGPLPPGGYQLIARNGSDQNTLLDNCGTNIPVGSSVPFTFALARPTPMDSLKIPGCGTDLLELVFRKRILCRSIAPDGSDFIISGPSPVTITGAVGSCDAKGLSYLVQVKLAGPITNGGDYRINLAKGNDGNTLIDECGQETLLPASLPFTMKDTVSALFDEQILWGCESDTVVLSYPSKNGVNQWIWTFDGLETSNTQNQRHIYPVFGTKTIRLIVSNGFCNDTASETILLDNGISAAFEAPNMVCPKDPVTFMNNSTGIITTWTWDFGDGSGSADQTPQDHHFGQTGAETKYPVSLVIENKFGCKDTAVQYVDVLKSCYIAVPSAFTPNGDGLNDYLYPLNALKADNLQFLVYNRLGQLIFETKNWNNRWDGTMNGRLQPSGTYVWTLQYTDHDSGKKFFQKGTTFLIR
ncbi:T9SS type B sorting domain-containing protein [Flavitalea flava]